MSGGWWCFLSFDVLSLLLVSLAAKKITTADEK